MRDRFFLWLAAGVFFSGLAAFAFYSFWLQPQAISSHQVDDGRYLDQRVRLNASIDFVRFNKASIAIYLHDLNDFHALLRNPSFEDRVRLSDFNGPITLVGWLRENRLEVEAVWND